MHYNHLIVGISHDISLSPITARIHCDNSIKNCFGSLLDDLQNSSEGFDSSVVLGHYGFFLVRTFRSDETDFAIVMQIFFVDKSSLFASTSHQTFFLNGTFASANKLKDGEKVFLHPLSENALNRCESVVINPLDNDDWEKIVSSTEQIEELLLGQLRVIQTNMRICVHFKNGQIANFTIGEILPRAPMANCFANGNSLSHPPAFLMAYGTRLLVIAPHSAAASDEKLVEGNVKGMRKEIERAAEGTASLGRAFVPGMGSEVSDCFYSPTVPAHFDVSARALCCPIVRFLPLAPFSSSNPFFSSHRRLCLLLNTFPFIFLPHGTFIKKSESHELRFCCVCVQFDDGEGAAESHLAEAVLVTLPQERQQTTTPFGHFCERLALLIERLRLSSGLLHCWLSPSLSRLFSRSADLRWIKLRPIPPDQLKNIDNLVISTSRGHLAEVKQTFMDLIASARQLNTPWLLSDEKSHWNLQLPKVEAEDKLNQNKMTKRIVVKLMDDEEKTHLNANNRIGTYRLSWPLSPKMSIKFRNDDEMNGHLPNESHSEANEKDEAMTPYHQKCVQMVDFPAQLSVLSSLSHSIRTFLRCRCLPSVVDAKGQSAGEEAAVPLALLLEGPCGSGKSILLAKLMSKLRTTDEDNAFVPVAADIVDCSDAGNSLLRFVDSVDSAMADLVNRWPSVLLLDNFDICIGKFSNGGDPSSIQNDEQTKRLIYQKIFGRLFGEFRRRKVPIVCAISGGIKISEEISAWEGPPLKWETHRIGPIDKCTQKEVLNKLSKHGDIIQTNLRIESANFGTIGELCRLVERMELQIGANRTPAESSEDILSVASICKRNEFGEGELSIRFDQIAGLESVKSKLTEIFIWPSRYPSLFAFSGVRVGHRAILHGPSGCGKSMLIRALAGSMGATVFSVRGPQLLSKYVGQSEQNIRQLFAKANASKPALVIFDEIDAIAPQRGSDNSHVTDRMVNQMLTELDGFEGNTEGVFVIAVTNRIDLIDKALLRPGRFDFRLRIGLPDFGLRLAVLRLYCVTEWGVHLSDNVNLKLIAQQTEGFSGAEMRAVDCAFHFTMEVIDPRNTLLSNQEVLELLNQAKGRHIPTKDSQNHNTIVYEALKYLNETPATAQRRQDIISLINALKKFKLTGAEIIQIVNLRPKQAVEVQLIVEESEERLTEEQVDELVETIINSLPRNY
ncbi:hypothetical protein niasHT_018211 [Heterodera trifolii]|uniref:DNA-directed RNA polymerase III subunit RPC9 n=1 Tax=Heterodera trifolii TaxID=157864 RepID=A0ABD2KZ02_9BILA